MSKFYDAAYRIARKTVDDTEMKIAAPATLFTVEGAVELAVFGVLGEAVDSLGNLTLEVGIAGNTAALIAQAAKAALLINTVWNDAVPANPESMPTPKIVNGADIIQTTGTADANAGSIDYVCLWKPLTPGAKLVAA